MLKFAQVDELLDLDGITLPVAGKNYLIPPPNALTGLEITARVAKATTSDPRESAQQLQAITDEDERNGGNLARQVLGAAFDEMIADEVPWPMLRLAFQTGLIWVAQGVEQAALFWAAGGGEMGKAPTPPATPPGRRGSADSRSRNAKRASTGPTSSTTGT